MRFENKLILISEGIKRRECIEMVDAFSKIFEDEESAVILESKIIEGFNDVLLGREDKFQSAEALTYGLLAFANAGIEGFLRFADLTIPSDEEMELIAEIEEDRLLEDD